MKEILISIQPRWCELIANRKKTVEVRKTRPKIDTPFKCYIYCTSSNVHECLMLNENGTKLIYALNYKTAIPCGGYVGNGKVIGEFVCDNIITDKTFGHNDLFKTSACMGDEDISAYCLNEEMYCWHISDLVIYDKPKDLSEFKSYNCSVKFENGYPIPIHEIKRPPQSWCYVIKE